LSSSSTTIIVGILRGVFAHTKLGSKANKTPYVYTNPSKDTELFTCDKVFVLSQTPVGIKAAKVINVEMMMMMIKMIVMIIMLMMMFFLIVAYFVVSSDRMK